MEPTQQIPGIRMFTDVDPINQPENTYRFALNAVMESAEGDLYSLPTEGGNSLCVELERNEEIIGAKYLGDDKYILMITDDTTSKIVLQKECQATVLIEEECLGFKKEWPINIISRTIRGCDTVIYFTDKNNPYRSVNIDRIDQYYDENGDFNCDLISHFPGVTYPDIEIQSVNDNGGVLQVGSYQFAVQYLDASYNEIEWSYITNPVIIYDDNISSGFGEIDGAWNGETGIRPNGVPATNKSITLSITNLDTKFSFIRIAGIESTEGLATVTNVYYTPEIPINDGTVTYTYTGDVSSYTIGSILDIQIPRPYINTVNFHAQIDNRLILANTSSPNYSFCGFQSYANNITSRFTIKQVNARDQRELGNPKNPLSWYSSRGFAADEVYAFGIVYVFKSGYHSPAFHIPGRTHNTLDMILDTVGTTVNIADVRHVDPNIEEGDTVRRWRWKNTAQLDGTMAYWRADNATYPEDLDCDGEYIYGSLAGESIRHHKFPDRRLIDIYEKTSDTTGVINIFGIQFDNVEYPHEDIVGHYFVYVKRTDFNRTVLDRGILTSAYVGDDATLNPVGLNGYFGIGLVGYPNPLPLKGARFVSPKTLVDKQYLDGAYFKIEKQYKIGTASLEDEDYGGGGLGSPDARISYVAYNWGTSGFTSANSFNRTYNSSIYVTPNSSALQVNNFEFNGNIQNRSYFNWFNAYNLIDSIHDDDYGITDRLGYAGPLLAANKIDRDVNTDLAGLQYARIHNNILSESTSPEIYGGDVFISAINYMDCHIKGGDNEELDFLSEVSYDSGLWIESEINMFMRHGTSDPCGEYYTGGSVANYAINRLTDKVDGEYVYKTIPCEENYFFNKDYAKLNEESIYLPVDRRYECCSRCLEDNTNRIWYSVSTDPASQDDGYKIVLPNNYKNIYGEDIEVTDLFVHMDNLYVRTERALYLFPTREQAIQTNEASIYIGNGEFFSLEPRKILTADNGYAGGKDEFTRISTEFGTFFFDRNQNKIFQLSGLNNLKEISALGIGNELQSRLKLSFLDDWKTLSDEPYPQEGTTGRYGIGYVAGYDPRYKRYIFHKRDYKYIGSGQLRWTGQHFTVDVNNTSVIVDFFDKQYFESRSFTISFKPANDGWTSYHSYMPKLIYSGANTFFTTNNGSWKHGDDNFLSFYGAKYPYIVDMIVNKNPAQTWVTDSFSYIGNAKEKEGEYFNVIDDITFNGIVAYNDTQSSGFQNIMVQNKATIYETINTPLLANRSNSTWNINGFLNYRTDKTKSLFSSSWSNTYNQYFIDKVPNPLAINTQKNIYEVDRIRGHYFGARLYYYPTSRDIKLTTNIVETLKRYSIR